MIRVTANEHAAVTILAGYLLRIVGTLMSRLAGLCTASAVAVDTTVVVVVVGKESVTVVKIVV